MNQENLIPVYGNATFKRDPTTGALLNCNYDKLEISKTTTNLNAKYKELDNKINSVEQSLNEIKTMLNQLLLGNK